MRSLEKEMRKENKREFKPVNSPHNIDNCIIVEIKTRRNQHSSDLLL